MESEIITEIIDLGVTAIFLIYLLSAIRQQRERFDQYVERLLSTLSSIEAEREAGYERVRDRYDDVIAAYAAARDRLMIDISAKLDKGLEEMERRYNEERLARLAREKGGK